MAATPRQKASYCADLVVCIKRQNSCRRPSLGPEWLFSYTIFVHAECGLWAECDEIRAWTVQRKRRSVRATNEYMSGSRSPNGNKAPSVFWSTESAAGIRPVKRLLEIAYFRYISLAGRRLLALAAIVLPQCFGIDDSHLEAGLHPLGTLPQNSLSSPTPPECFPFSNVAAACLFCS